MESIIIPPCFCCYLFKFLSLLLFIFNGLVGRKRFWVYGVRESLSLTVSSPPRARIAIRRKMKKVRVPKEKEGRKGWKEEDKGGGGCGLWRKICGVEIGPGSKRILYIGRLR